MKKIGYVLAGVVLSVSATAATAGGGHGHGGFGGHLFSERGIERMADRLDLTDAQTDQVKAIVEANRAELQTLRGQISERAQALRGQVKTGYDEASARAQANALGDLIGEQAFLTTRMGSQIHAVLTPEQQAELGEHMERRGHHGRGHDRD